MISRSRLARAVICFVAGLGTASCGASLMNLPAGPGAPAADAREALSQATDVCRTITTFSAEASVSGSAGGRSLRARLNIGLQAPDSTRLEAIGPFARPVFTLATRGDSGTLLLHDDNRILEDGRPAALLEALTGVPLGAADLREALTGCASSDASTGEARQLGDDWRTLQNGATTIYLHRQPRTGPWQLVAAVHRPSDRPEWRAEYRDFANGLPQRIRLVSIQPDRFDLRLSMSGIELNAPLPAAAFEVKVPPGAQPITLDELRRAGPLRDEP
jgi:outer membrane lipoprotein-sorting protein